mmetsp:Transcript_30895/g.51048  ORF Transcript_30895/g.51048 Transcript_30895/m.51048 type:complete len:554 (-) Transcript_30895:339-2000(-)
MKMSAVEREMLHISILAYFQWLSKQQHSSQPLSVEETIRTSVEKETNAVGTPHARDEQKGENHDPAASLEIVQELSKPNIPDYAKVIDALNEVWEFSEKYDAVLKSNEVFTERNNNIPDLQNRFAKFPVYAARVRLLEDKMIYNQHHAQPLATRKAPPSTTFAAATPFRILPKGPATTPNGRKRKDAPKAPSTAVTHNGRKRKDPPAALTSTTATTEKENAKKANKSISKQPPEEVIKKLRTDKINQKRKANEKIKRLVSTIERLKAEKAKTLESVIVLAIPPKMPKPFVSRNRVVVDWAERYAELLAFRKGHGHCRVPVNTRFGRWVGHLRAAKKKIQKEKEANDGERTNTESSLLTDERIKLLNDCDFEWELRVTAPTWENRFEQLKKYKEENGDTRVPRAWKPDPSLGEWVHSQRGDYRNKKACIQGLRTELFESIGFEWTPHRHQGTPMKLFEERFKDLVEYRRKRGHANIPKPDAGLVTVLESVLSEEEKKCQSLYRWAARMRAEYHLVFIQGLKSSLDRTKVKKLEDVGFVWGEPADVKFAAVVRRP